MPAILFLGFNIYPEKRRLKQHKGVYYQRKLKQKLKGVQDGVLEFDQIETSVAGWVNHVRYGNTVGLRKAILKPWINQTQHEGDGV